MDESALRLLDRCRYRARHGVSISAATERKQMNSSFKIESRHARQLKIKHIGEGHQYLFHFGIQPDGRRVLSTGYRLNSEPAADHDGEHFIHEAFSFAENEFRLAGKID
jgi:hypothetical protein